MTHVYVFHFVEIAVLTALGLCNLTKGSVDSQCDVEGGWKYFGGNCYKYMDAARTFDQANKTCVMYNASLAKTQTSEMQEMLTDYIASHGLTAWLAINITDNTTTYLMKWTDGNNITGGFWRPDDVVLRNISRPSNISRTNCSDSSKNGACMGNSTSALCSGETGNVTCMANITDHKLCALINSTLPNKLQNWQSVNCDATVPFTCQKQAVVHSCLDGWNQVGNQCFKSFEEKMTWTKARQNCKKQNADLAVISGSAEQTFLSGKILSEVWIGLNDRGQEGKYVWLEGKQKANITYWKDGQPVEQDIGKRYGHNCAAMLHEPASPQHGKWTLYPCAFHLGFICQKNGHRNIVLGKLATQSSTYSGHKASLAIGDCTSKDFSRGCCSLTNKDYNPWWQLDLGKQYRIETIVVHRRWDNCKICKPRLYNMRIFVSDERDMKDSTDNSDLRAQYNKTVPTAVTTLKFPKPRKGRYIRIDIAGRREYLTLCNVQVFEAEPEDVQSTGEAQVQVKSHSSKNCDGTVKADRSGGFITSPNYPSNYPHRMDCRWLISVDSNSRIHLTFDFFKTERSSTCTMDYVIIYDGPNTNSKQLLRHCGNGVPSRNDITSSSGEVLVRMRSDSSVTYKGIKLRYYSTALSGRVAYIESPLTGHFYRLFTYGLAWADAKEHCDTEGGYLVSSPGSNEKQYLKDICSSENITAIWLGSGKKTDWTEERNQRANQCDFPRSSKGIGINLSPDCGCNVFNVNEGQTGTVVKRTCNDRFTYVCRKEDPLDKAKKWSMPNKKKCSNGWTTNLISGECYKFHTTTKPWDQAKAVCQLENGTLDVITSPEDQLFIYDNVHLFRSLGIWMGVYAQEQDRSFVGLNGTKLLYTDWAQAPQFGRDCATLSLLPHIAGRWNGENCNSVYPFVCSYMPATMPAVVCDTDWVPGPDGCYMFNSDQLAYSSARIKCMSEGGNLVNIMSPIEHEFIMANIDVLGPSSFFIGLVKVYDVGTWQWTNGSKLLYTNWKSGEPNKKTLSTCGSIERTTGKWKAISCMTDSTGSICKRNFKSAGARQISKKVCPDKWYHESGFCYYIDLNATIGWLQAYDKCKALGAALASIHSENENTALIKIVRKAIQNKTGMAEDNGSVPAVWVGLAEKWTVSKIGKRVFFWADGTTMNYTKWSENKNTDNGNCASILTYNGEWNCTSCHENRSYICKTTAGEAKSQTTETEASMVSPVSAVQTSNQLTTGQITGIVFGMLGAFMTGACVMYIYKRLQHKPKVKSPPEGFVNALFDKSKDSVFF